MSGRKSPLRRRTRTPPKTPKRSPGPARSYQKKKKNMTEMLNAMTVVQLKQHIDELNGSYRRNYKIRKTGTKAQLIQRIIRYQMN